MKSGILLLDKVEGMTSRDVDNKVGRYFHTHKVGHLGTLDPFATGLLVVAVEKGTKYLPFLCDEPKTYVACLKLGESTTTGDTEGEILEKTSARRYSETEIRNVLDSFLGDSFQLPPMTSAIKIDGVPLYKYAHKGETIGRKERPIRIYKIDLISYKNDLLTFEADVSSGTYIRVLGEDIAKKLGTIGHLLSLRRIKIANIDVSNAFKIEDINEDKFIDPLPLLSGFEKIDLSLEESIKAKNGMRFSFPNSSSEKVLLCFNDEPIAIYEKEKDGFYRSLRGLF